MAGFHVLTAAERLDLPQVRRIGIGDLTDSLREGWRDFWAKPSHLAFLGLIYPLMGVAIALWSSGQNAWPLLRLARPCERGQCAPSALEPALIRPFTKG